MQVKVFEANDMNSGLKLIKEELGADALIISTKTIRGGRLGLGKNRLEITAAVDNAVPPPSRREFDTMGVEHPAFATDSYNSLTHFDDLQEKEELFFNQDNQEALPSLANPYLKGANSMVKKQKTVVPPKNSSTFKESVTEEKAETLKQPSNAFGAPVGTQDTRIHDEMHELKNLVRNLAGEVARLQPSYNHSTQPPSLSSTAESPIICFLKSKGLNQNVSATLSSFLETHLDPESLENKMLVTQHVLQSIQGMLDVSPLLQDHEGQQQRIAFVGPTGVGKTTTLAKIAAAKLSRGNQKIALITIDTYRIAAVEQIKVYGEIMNLPVDVVISPDQLENSLAKHHDCDLILIDTAGRSPKDELSIEELRTFLKPELDIERHLVLSASTREEELIDTISRFQKLQINSTIYTKTDECSQLGSLLNVQLQNNTPISCITNGQRVPEDLVDISPNAVAQLIMSIH